jgi:hypothetical protein
MSDKTNQALDGRPSHRFFKGNSPGCGLLAKFETIVKQRILTEPFHGCKSRASGLDQACGKKIRGKATIFVAEKRIHFQDNPSSTLDKLF